MPNQSRSIQLFRTIFVFFVCGFLLSLGLTREAVAQNDPNGTYTFDIYIGESLSNSQTWNMTTTSGVITGNGSGGSFTWTISGSVSGSAFQAVNIYNQLNYSASFVGTITNGGNDITGTWGDSSEQSGRFIARKNSAPPPPPPSNKRDTATAVSCNRGPAPLDDFVCTATVGSVDNAAPNPTGEVVFTAQEGSFRYGNKCLLTPSGTSLAFCAVTYIQPVQPIGIGAQVPVSAAFGGDSTYNPSSGSPSGFSVTKLPATPPICVSDTPAACPGLNADLPSTVSSQTGLGSVVLSYFGSSGIDSSSLQRAFPISRPRTTSEVSAQVFYNLHLRDNPALRGLLSTPRVGSSFRGGQVSLGFASGNVKFGQSRDTRVNNTRPGLNVLAASGRLGVSSVNIRITVRGFRKGDRRPTNVYRTVNFRLN